ncbi:glycosyltransferase [Niallia sp. 03091]|uniref:glycosyltransferase n=1 Tax=Niallia sp. 03091 TaxID=3458059 RepID=UPI00404464C9
MIFVTVGTHEQQFNRLIKKIDNLKRNGLILDDIFMQTGYCNYTPNSVDYKKLLSYEEMNYYAEKANIIITHGGPASIFLAYSYNKVPIVVPRLKQFNEHIDNHQLLFAKRLEKENKIILIEEIDSIGNVINSFADREDGIFKDFNSNTKLFKERFERTIQTLFS